MQLSLHIIPTYNKLKTDLITSDLVPYQSISHFHNRKLYDILSTTETVFMNNYLKIISYERLGNTNN